MRAPRFVEHYVAHIGGYFWMPCPACGKMFSGREAIKTIYNRHFNSIVGSSRDCVICPQCTNNGVGCRSQATKNLFHYGCEFAKEE